MRNIVQALAAGLLLAGCAGDHRSGARAGGAEGPRLAVPFFPDRRDQWGPAALAGVLSYYGRPATPVELRREIYFPKQRGSVALDLQNAARAHGLSARMSTGTMRVLKRELDAGRPVIVLVNTGFRFLPVRQYMVVTGYNEWLGGVYAHFGPNKDAFLKYSRFESDWEKAGHWVLLADDGKSAPEPRSTRIELPAEEPPARPVKRPRPRVDCAPAAASRDAEMRCAAPVSSTR